ncbi:MAG: hypothetical protein HC859_08640, partial [Bacteroidia bacterium]|nr:hypothetical protein [Bacteroidia bacterium]
MKYLLALVFAAPLIAEAQQSLATFDLKSTAREIQAQPLGDSVLVSFVDGVLPATVDTGIPRTYPALRSFWVTSDGTVSPFVLKTIDNQRLCGITRHDGEHYFYSFSGNSKNPVLNTLRYARESQDYVLHKPLEFEGRIAGVFVDSDLFVMSFQKKEQTFKVTRVHKDSIAEETLFRLPFFLWQFKGETIQYIPETSLTLLNAFMAPVKIYRRGETITIVVDEAFDEYAENESGKLYKTSIYNLNLVSGTIETRIII